MRRLAGFAVVLVAVYAGLAYYPVGAKYFRVRYAAQQLADSSVGDPQGDYELVGDFLSEVQSDTGLSLNHSDVRLDNAADGRRRVVVDCPIPVHFPFLHTTHVQDFTIRVTASRAYSI